MDINELMDSFDDFSQERQEEIFRRLTERYLELNDDFTDEELDDQFEDDDG